MVDVQESRAALDVDRRQRAGVETVVSCEPEHARVGLTVTYELIRKQTARVTLTGELTASAVDQTRDALLAALTWAVTWIEVDAEALELCDAAGLQLLVALDRRCSEQAGGLRVVRAQSQLIGLLHLGGAPKLLTRLGTLIG